MTTWLAFTQHLVVAGSARFFWRPALASGNLYGRRISVFSLHSGARPEVSFFWRSGLLDGRWASRISWPPCSSACSQRWVDPHRNGSVWDAAWTTRCPLPTMTSPAGSQPSMLTCANFLWTWSSSTWSVLSFDVCYRNSVPEQSSTENG